MPSSERTQGTTATTTASKSDVALLREVTNRYLRDQKENVPPLNTSTSSRPRRKADLANVSLASQNSSVASLTPGPKAGNGAASRRCLPMNMWGLSTAMSSTTTPAKKAPTAAEVGSGATSFTPQLRAGEATPMDVSASASLTATVVPSAVTALSFETSPARRFGLITPCKRPLMDGESPSGYAHDDSAQLCFNAVFERSVQTNSSVDETPMKGCGATLDLALEDLLRGCDMTEPPAAVPMADEEVDGDTNTSLQAAGESVKLHAKADPSTPMANSRQSRIASALRVLSTPKRTPTVSSSQSGFTTTPSLQLPPDDQSQCGLAQMADKSSAFARHLAIIESDEDSLDDSGSSAHAGQAVKDMTELQPPPLPMPVVSPFTFSTQTVCDDSRQTENSDHAAWLREEEVERLLDGDIFAAPTGTFQVSALSRMEDDTALRSFTVTSLAVAEGSDTHNGDANRHCQTVNGTRCALPAASASETTTTTTASAHASQSANARPSQPHPFVKAAPGTLISLGGRRVPVDKLHLLNVTSEATGGGAGPSVRRMLSNTESVSHGSTTTATATATAASEHTAKAGRLRDPPPYNSAATAKPSQSRTAAAGAAAGPSERRFPAGHVPVVTNTREAVAHPATHAPAHKSSFLSQTLPASNAANLLVTLQFFGSDVDGARAPCHPALLTFVCNHDVATDAALAADDVSSQLLARDERLRVVVGQTYEAHVYSERSGFDKTGYNDVGVCTAIREMPAGVEKTAAHGLVSGVILREADLKNNVLDSTQHREGQAQSQRAIAEARRQCDFLNLPFVIDSVHVTFDNAICVLYYHPKTAEDASRCTNTDRLIRVLQFRLKCKAFLRLTEL